MTTDTNQEIVDTKTKSQSSTDQDDTVVEGAASSSNEYYENNNPREDKILVNVEDSRKDYLANDSKPNNLVAESPPRKNSIVHEKQNGYHSSKGQQEESYPNLQKEKLADNYDKISDMPDNSGPVYRSTTELIDSDDSEDSSKSLGFFDCCGCWRVRRCWFNLKESVEDFSSRQWYTLIMLCLGTLTSSLSVCLFPPFFPRLAEEKGETATVYGMVIGTNCLTAFIVTPIIGKNLEKIGVNFAFIAGTLCSGACCCLSGFLEFFGPGMKFVLMSISIRICHATANAGIITSTIAFIASEFPNSVGFLFSLTRATMNLAQMFGPILGGALVDVGGFKMPFFVLGAMQIMVSFICSYLLPEFIGRQKDKNCDQDKKASWSIMRIPGLWISFLTFIFSTMSNGFLSITLEPRVLRKFCISPLFVGVLFGLKDGANCLASPIWGWLCDRFTNVKLFIVIGSLMGAISFIMLGPFPGLPIENTLLIVVISLFFNGVGVGGQQVAGVISAMRDAVLEGYPDDAETHAFIAGLWSSLSGAGRFVSRTGSGILVDTIGFRNTSAIITCLNIFVFISTSVFMCFSKKKPPPSRCIEDQSSREQLAPKEPVASKSANITVPVIREDLEGSFMIGSASSRVSRRSSRAAFYDSNRD